MRSSLATLSTDRCEYPDRIRVALMCSTKSRRRLILISRTSRSSVFWMVIVELLHGSECILGETNARGQAISGGSLACFSAGPPSGAVRPSGGGAPPVQEAPTTEPPARVLAWMPAFCRCNAVSGKVGLGAGQSGHAVIPPVTERRIVGVSGTPAFAPEQSSSLRARRGWAVG